MVSVVIPAFNAGKFIRRTIDSVLAQVYKDYEIIVVDDGSTDDTAEVVKTYGSKVRYIYQQNAGDGPARNTGIYAAKGKWIAFLDHDDEWLPEKLQLQMELLTRNPQLRWCGANLYKQSGIRKAVAGDEKRLTDALASTDYFKNFFSATSKLRFWFLTSTMVIHREVFESVGIFDTHWMRCADLDMWWRIAYKFPAIGYLPRSLAILHVDVQDIVSTKLRLKSKSGEETWKLVTRHLKLADENKMLEEFKPIAKYMLQDGLQSAIFRGYKQNARALVKDFRDLVPWHWRVATYVLTIFPKATSVAIRTVAYIKYRLGKERDVSRRWIEPKDTETGNKKDCER